MLQPNDPRPDVHLRLPMGAEAARLARWALVHAVDSFDGETRFKIDLLVSELVANAVQHSDAWVTDAIEVCLFTDGVRTRVEVTDPGRAEGALILPMAWCGTDARGFGLALLDRLADDWGWTSPADRPSGSRSSAHYWSTLLE